MNQSPFIYLKFSLVIIVVLGVYTLAALGKIDATTATAGAVAAIVSLVAALGISSAGTSVANAMRAHTVAMMGSVSSADEVRRGAAGASQRGYITGNGLTTLVLVSGLIGSLLLFLACTAGKLDPAKVTTDVSEVACILTTSASDQSAGMSAAAIVDDVIAKCGVTAANVATIFDAMAAANDRGLTQAQARTLSVAAKSK